MNNKSKLQKQATMRDVAELAGVSQPTVSRVLNKKNTTISISEETREKVLAAAAELNYHPNVLARSLRTQKTQMIAIMIADVSNNFYHRIVRSIQDVASDYHYDVMIANSDHDYDTEKHFLDAVSRRPVDGIIIVPIHLTHEDIDTFVKQTGTPTVVLGQHIEHPDVDVVYASDGPAMYDATRWLIEEQGYRKLGFIGVPDDLPPGPRRFRGFQQAVADAGLTIDPKHIISSDFTLDGGKRAAQQLLEVGDLPSALVVLNDLMAIGAILTLTDAGCCIPDDIAVLGFDDIMEATIVRPALTTIAQDSYDIGQKLSHLLFERIENPSLPTRRLESPLTLIKRGSA